jgi:hypothetical protein
MRRTDTSVRPPGDAGGPDGGLWGPRFASVSGMSAAAEALPREIGPASVGEASWLVLGFCVT